MPDRCTASALVELVGSVPGIAGVDPSLGSTLRGVDAMLRGATIDDVRYGVVIDRDEARVTVEVALTGEQPTREAVTALQRVVKQSIAQAREASDEELPGRDWEVLVKVQSFAAWS